MLYYHLLKWNRQNYPSAAHCQLPTKPNLLQEVTQTFTPSQLLGGFTPSSSTSSCCLLKGTICTAQCPENQQVRALAYWDKEDCFVLVYLQPCLNRFFKKTGEPFRIVIVLVSVGAEQPRLRHPNSLWNYHLEKEWKGSKTAGELVAFGVCVWEKIARGLNSHVDYSIFYF